MNSFQSFVNYIFKITEAYELDESNKDVALLQIMEITRHILRAFQHLSINGEDYARNAVNEIESKFVTRLNRDLEKLVWKKEIVKEKLDDELQIIIRNGYYEYEKLYQKNNILYPIKGDLGINLEIKILEGNVTFEDLGLIENTGNNKRLQFTFDFNTAIQRNKGEVTENKI